jgi:ubiquinone biosynthesis protein Coq4
VSLAYIPTLVKLNRNLNMIAALGETTAGLNLSRLRDLLLESPEGWHILKDRPCVNSSTINMNKLAQYPDGCFGRAYVTWLERCTRYTGTCMPLTMQTFVFN